MGIRILVVGRNLQAMVHDYKQLFNPNAEGTFSMPQMRWTDNSGNEILFRDIRNDNDIEKLRGQRFVFVIEHASFFDTGGLSERLKLTVLR
jgi:hypothetical protein